MLRLSSSSANVRKHSTLSGSINWKILDDGKGLLACRKIGKDAYQSTADDLSGEATASAMPGAVTQRQQRPQFCDLILGDTGIRQIRFSEKTFFALSRDQAQQGPTPSLRQRVFSIF